MHKRDVGTAAALGERHLQRVEYQRGAHVAGELPADDPAAEDVDHEREVHDPFPAAQVREVGYVELIRARRGEVALDQVGRRCASGSAIVVRHGRPRRLAPWIECSRISRWPSRLRRGGSVGCFGDDCGVSRGAVLEVVVRGPGLGHGHAGLAGHSASPAGEYRCSADRG
jgi:hypothetical protein